MTLDIHFNKIKKLESSIQIQNYFFLFLINVINTYFSIFIYLINVLYYIEL